MKHIIRCFVFICVCTVAAYAQETGAKVMLRSAEGTWYIGTIAEARGGKYRVTYDNTDFDAWLTPDQFTLAANPSKYTKYKTTTAATNPATTNAPAQKQKTNNSNIPTVADIEEVVRKTWERVQTSFEPKVTVTFNGVTIGASRTANLAQEYEGIPKGAMVTTAKVDFTANTFYTSGVKGVRRIMTALVYRNDFKEWSVMNTGTVYPQ